MIEKELVGLLLVNKEAGPTSHDIIDRLRKLTGIRKIGHAGTLDPFAEGLLLCFISRGATKKIQGYMHLDKEYIATVRFGRKTDTYDIQGEVLEDTSGVSFDDFPIRLTKALKKFRGPLEQVPPMYSAIKVKGKKLYELAREGKTIERKPRNVVIEELKLVEVTNDQYPLAVLKVRCSSGTYIRSLAYDLGEELGTGAFLEELVRTKIGKYSLENAIDAKSMTKEDIEASLVEA